MIGKNYVGYNRNLMPASQLPGTFRNLLRMEKAMIVSTDDTRPNVARYGLPVADVAAVAKQFLVRGAKRYSGMAGKWHLPGRAGVNLKLHRIFYDDKAARRLQSVPLAPKRSFIFRAGAKEAPRIHGELKNTFWRAGSAGREFLIPGLRTGWGKPLSWLGGGHVLPGRMRHLAGRFALLSRNEKTAIRHLHIKPPGIGQLNIKPPGREGNVRSFAPMRVVAPSPVSGQDSRLGRSVHETNIRMRSAGQPRLQSQELASVDREIKKNDEVSERGIKEVHGSVVQDPHKRVADMSRAINDYFVHQARLPPSGAMAFDPRLTPAWAGLKLPV